MLPVVLSEKLNCGQCQPRNKLMCQCRNILRAATSQWMVLICSINLCPHVAFALGQRNAGGLLGMGGKRFNGKCMEPFWHCTGAKNWYVRVPKRGCHDNFGIFWKK